MKLCRRRFLHLAAGAAALPAAAACRDGASLSDAAGAPDRWLYRRAVRPDIVARLMGQWLSERLGQQFVVENRPGAGTNIGTEVVVQVTAGRLYAPHGRCASTRSMPRSMTSSASISFAISRRSRPSLARAS